MKTSLVVAVLMTCLACQSIHTLEYEDATAEARVYLKVLAGDRFDEVVEDHDLYPLFDEEASYRETALAARRAIRWRIDIAGGIESGAINLSMILSGLLGRKPRVDADE